MAQVEMFPFDDVISWSDPNDLTTWVYDEQNQTIVSKNDSLAVSFIKLPKSQQTLATLSK